jgi:DNA-binding MarR family transcriptional regulator
LELLSKEPLGRNKLAEKLNVGDGAVRTIISRLKDAGLIETSKTGCGLTEKGKAIWSQFEGIFPKQIDLAPSELNPSDCNHAFLIRNCGEKVGTGINQRDAAIIAGARKALVMVYRKGHLCIESVSDSLEKQFPKAAAQILEQMKPQENDCIVVATAETPLKAKRGAFAASWSLISV